MNEKLDKLLEEQRKRYRWQFGQERPVENDTCRLCGKPYGLHYGSECPMIGYPLEAKP